MGAASGVGKWMGRAQLTKQHLRSECVRITDFYDSAISMIHIEEFHRMPRSGV